MIGDAVVADSAELVKVVVSVKYVGWSIMGVVVVSFWIWFKSGKSRRKTY